MKKIKQVTTEIYVKHYITYTDGTEGFSEMVRRGFVIKDDHRDPRFGGAFEDVAFDVKTNIVLQSDLAYEVKIHPCLLNAL